MKTRKLSPRSLEALRAAEHVCSWNNVRPEDLGIYQSLARRGYVTKATAKYTYQDSAGKWRTEPDRRLDLTEKGREALEQGEIQE